MDSSQRWKCRELVRLGGSNRIYTGNRMRLIGNNNTTTVGTNGSNVYSISLQIHNSAFRDTNIQLSFAEIQTGYFRLISKSNLLRFPFLYTYELPVPTGQYSSPGG